MQSVLIVWCFICNSYHGYGSSGLEQVFYSLNNPLADEETFAVIYPDGPSPLLTGTQAPAKFGSEIQRSTENARNIQFRKQIMV